MHRMDPEEIERIVQAIRRANIATLRDIRVDNTVIRCYYTGPTLRSGKQVLLHGTYLSITSPREWVYLRHFLTKRYNF